jgi:uncharacterized membrane protein
LLALVLIIVLIAPVIISNSTKNRVRDIQDETEAIRHSLDKLLQKLNEMELRNKAPIEKQSLEAEKPVESRYSISDANLANIIISESKEEVTKEETDEPLNAESIINKEHTEEELWKDEQPEEESILEEAFVMNSKPQIIDENKAAAPKSDIERFIGEKLLSLVGIGVFVLGIFFLVKWAIDQHLINDAGKVSIGILSGILLIGTAHRIRNSVRAFSSILVGGGLAVFYFTVYIAFQDYHLLSQTLAFIIMVIVTLFAVMLSIVYDKKELAIIAIVGGFCTPFFVSTGEGNYKVLFSYLLILNIGMFILANFKRWSLVNIISYAFTILIFGGWMFSKFDPKVHASGSLVFATLFYITFFAMNLIYNIRNQQQFKPIEISMLLSNTFLYYGIGMYCLYFIQNGNFQGVFTISVAAINFLVAFFLYKKEQIDRNLVYLLIGLVLTFVSLAGPIQLEGNYITLFWAMEMVLLLWLGQKSGIRIIREATMLVTLLTLISLFMDWNNIYNNGGDISILFNQAFITGFFTIAVFTLKRHLLKNEQKDFWILNLSTYRQIIQIILILLIYLVPLLELIKQFETHFTSQYLNEGSSNQVYISTGSITQNFIVLYHYIFLIIGLLIAVKRNKNIASKFFAILGGILVLLYISFNSYSIELRNNYLEFGLYKNFFYGHFITPVLALLLLCMIGKYVLTQVKLRSKWSVYFAWFATITTVIILSCEVLHIWVITQYQPGFTEYSIATKGIKICLPILWGIMSFAIMANGMSQKLKSLRIISLSLFTLTLLKLFIYDMADATQGGKIAAFISLGILLLIVSFMYQKLKGMIIDEPSETKKEQL